MTIHAMPERHSRSRLWQQFPCYMLAMILIGFGAMMFMPDAAERFSGGWAWIRPAPRLIGACLLALGLIHVVAWRIGEHGRYATYATMVLFGGVFFTFAGMLWQTSGKLGPGVIVYLFLAPLAPWIARYHRRLD